MGASDESCPRCLQYRGECVCRRAQEAREADTEQRIRDSERDRVVAFLRDWAARNSAHGVGDVVPMVLTDAAAAIAGNAHRIGVK